MITPSVVCGKVLAAEAEELLGPEGHRAEIGVDAGRARRLVGKLERIGHGAHRKGARVELDGATQGLDHAHVHAIGLAFLPHFPFGRFYDCLETQKRVIDFALGPDLFEDGHAHQLLLVAIDLHDAGLDIPPAGLDVIVGVLAVVSVIPQVDLEPRVLVGINYGVCLQSIGRRGTAGGANDVLVVSGLRARYVGLLLVVGRSGVRELVEMANRTRIGIGDPQATPAGIHVGRIETALGTHIGVGDPNVADCILERSGDLEHLGTRETVELAALDAHLSAQASIVNDRAAKELFALAAVRTVRTGTAASGDLATRDDHVSAVLSGDGGTVDVEADGMIAEVAPSGVVAPNTVRFLGAAGDDGTTLDAELAAVQDVEHVTLDTLGHTVVHREHTAIKLDGAAAIGVGHAQLGATADFEQVVLVLIPRIGIVFDRVEGTLAVLI